MKTQTVQFRINPKKKRAFEKYCKFHGTTTTEYLMESIDYALEELDLCPKCLQKKE